MEQPYLQLLRHILDHGERTHNRTGVDTISVFGYQMRFNLQDGFPALTTKKLAWRAVVGELLWFLEGSTDERRLAELTQGKPRSELLNVRTIWTDNADAQAKALGYTNTPTEKQLGPVYGYQWRNFGGVDQIKEIVDQIKNDPLSRRIILTSWNPPLSAQMALPPCHCFVQFRVIDNKLNCMLTQRSADAFLGVPFNIASYSLLTHILARECNVGVGEFIHSIGDAHIYENHIDAVEEQLTRKPYDPPSLSINENFCLEPLISQENYNFSLDTVEKFKLENYISHPAIKAEMAV